MRHPFKNTGVLIESVRSQRDRKYITKPEYKTYKLAMKIFKSIDPEYCKGECIVNFSRMNGCRQYVKRHTDGEDISPQYALSLWGNTPELS